MKADQSRERADTCRDRQVWVTTLGSSRSVSASAQWLLSEERSDDAHEQHRCVAAVEAAVVAAAGYLLQMLGGERPQRLLLELEFSFHHPRP